MCDAGLMWLICGGPTRCVQPEYTLHFFCQPTPTLSSPVTIHCQFTVTVMHACMHDTIGHNHVEAGQTAAYDEYNSVGQSMDPPQAAKIQK